MAAPLRSAAAHSWRIDQPIVDMAINRVGQWAAFSLANGMIAKLPAADVGVGPEPYPLHDGVSLSLAPDAESISFLSGGDDGRLYLIDPEVDAPNLLAHHPGNWIDHVASSAKGSRAYAIGKRLYLLDEAGRAQLDEPLSLPSAIGGLAFSPSGDVLAVSHYGGVRVFSLAEPKSDPMVLPWVGSHLNMVWSPDGQYLFSSLQDGGVHGWRFSSPLEMPGKGDELHMGGYAGKVRSMAFSAEGKYFVTSGAQQAVCWPFFDGGPQNKQPLMLGGVESHLVCRVAPHPRDAMAAVGYDDGMIVFAPYDGRMEILVHPPMAAEGAAVVGLAWNGEGDALVVALESGHVMLFTLASVSRFVRGRA